jgi:hypothetical protein
MWPDSNLLGSELLVRVNQAEKMLPGPPIWLVEKHPNERLDLRLTV